MAVPGGEQEKERWSTQDKFLILQRQPLSAKTWNAHFF